MDTSIIQAFNQVAARAHDAFPKQLNKLVVLMCPSHETPVYVSSEVADHLNKNTAAVKDAITERSQHMTQAGFGAVVNPYYQIGNEAVILIALQEKDPSRRYQMLFSLDHEIGHMVVENGAPLQNCKDPIILHHAECAADIYAALLHIQRFGRETLYQAYADTAPAIVLGISAIHYTSSVIDHVTRNMDKEQLATLPLEKIAQLAGYLAAAHHLELPTLSKLCTAFSPIAKQYHEKKELNDALIRQCITIIQDNQDDPDILHAGQAFFRHPTFNNYIKAVAKNDPWYRDALTLLCPEEKPPTARTPISRPKQSLGI